MSMFLRERERDLGQPFQSLHPPWIHFLSLQLLQVPNFPQNERRNGKCFTPRCWTGEKCVMCEAESSEREKQPLDQLHVQTTRDHPCSHWHKTRALIGWMIRVLPVLQLFPLVSEDNEEAKPEPTWGRRPFDLLTRGAVVQSAMSSFCSNGRQWALAASTLESANRNQSALA